MTENTNTNQQVSPSSPGTITAINQRLDVLAARIAALEALPSIATAVKQKTDTPPPIMMDGEGFWSWIGTSTVLPRIAGWAESS